MPKIAENECRTSINIYRLIWGLILRQYIRMLMKIGPLIFKLMKNKTFKVTPLWSNFECFANVFYYLYLSCLSNVYHAIVYCKLSIISAENNLLCHFERLRASKDALKKNYEKKTLNFHVYLP